MEVAIPKQILRLLRSGQHETEAGTLRLVGSVETILSDNKMPFFPAFTDHGMSHVGSVLSSAEMLIPKKVWKEEALEQSDAAILIGATLFHDLALHLREAGFIELIGEGSRFEPLPWFDSVHGDRSGDEPWSTLWREFRKEAQHFSRSQMTRILGPAATTPAIAFGDRDRDASDWTLNDHLLVGEFLRRHHARLAHEIAIYGFPGLTSDEFRPVTETLPALADAIGLTARSHNEDLRTMSAYLAYRTRGEGRPFGALIPFLMGLLRVADYFQLEPDRAPPLLMHLREPQSPVSVAEWHKHQAIERISWTHSHDPHAVHVQVSPDISISIYLQLQELVRSLQNEFDVTAAVLDETYGRSETPFLQLSRRRVDTNLADPGLLDQLGFVPKKAHPRSAEDLFRLVVGDLYGNEPVIAGRELLQNAVDAVRQLRRRRSEGGEMSGPLRELGAEVLVEIREGEDGCPNLLRVVDRGIGMTPDTVVNNFLSAGAVMTGIGDQPPPDSATAIAWMKTGRFGLGAFAAFLLGGEVRVTTRHFREPRGVTFVADYDGELVQLNWAEKVPVGTEIVVPFDDDALPGADIWSLSELADKFLRQTAAYLELQSPSVIYRRVSRDGSENQRNQKGEIPDPTKTLPLPWRSCEVNGIDALFWRVPPKKESVDDFAGGKHGARLAHNGMVIRPVVDHRNATYEWSSRWLEKNLLHPSLAVFDTRQILGIALNRYELTERSLPFEDALLESIGQDVVARGVAVGPSTHPLGKFWGLQPVFSRTAWMPFVPRLIQRVAKRDLFVVLVRNARVDEVAHWLTRELSSDHAWVKLPYRTVLPTLAPGQSPGSDYADLPKRLERLEKDLGRAPVVSGYWNLGEGRPFFFSTRRSFGIGGESQVEDLLLALGDKLRERFSGEHIGMAVLRRTPVKANETASALVRPWMEAVGGLLEVEVDARRARADQMSGTIPDIQRLITSWHHLERDDSDG